MSLTQFIFKKEKKLLILVINKVNKASPYLGAGMRAWAAMRKSSMMKEQTRLELNISSLIWEN